MRSTGAGRRSGLTGPASTRHLRCTAAALPARSYGRILGSNEKVRAAVIGLNGRGQSHIQGLKENVVALCDCDETVLNNRAKDMDVERFVDFRKRNCIL